MLGEFIEREVRTALDHQVDGSSLFKGSITSGVH